MRRVLTIAAASAFLLVGACAAQAADIQWTAPQQGMKQLPKPMQQQMVVQKTTLDQQLKAATARYQAMQPSVKSCQGVLNTNKALYNHIQKLKAQIAKTQQFWNQAATAKKPTPQDVQQQQLQMQRAMQEQQQMMQMMSQIIKQMHIDAQQVIKNIK